MEFNSINNANFQIANQKANLVKITQDLPQNTQQNTQQAQIQPQHTPQNINPSTMYDFQMAKMDNETMLKYLQNLLKIPNSIDKFVEQLNSKNIDPKIAKILVENLISIKVLSEFLNQNSNVAISKLMQTISTTLKSGVNDVSQLKEILSILNTIQANTNLNTNTLKELFLLYIPLNQPVFDKEIDFEDITSEENEKIKSSKISILLETINFSNILCCLNEIDNDILIDLYCDKDFRKNEFVQSIKTFSKEINITPLVEIKEKTSNKNSNKQNFKIISDGFVSQNLLIISHLIIKTIFNLDENLA